MGLKLKNIVLILGLLGSLYVVNADVSGVGYGDTKTQAKNEALADLAGKIRSEVRSSFESHDTDNSSNNKFDIKINTNLPILGADFIVIDGTTKIEAKATLSSTKVSKMYVKKLENIIVEIDSVLSKLQSSKIKLELYEDIYSLLLEYDRYESVALILDIDTPKKPSINKTQVKIEISKISSNIESIKVATSVLARTFTEKDIFIYPAKLKNYTTISQFSSVFVKELKAKLNTSINPNKAKYILVGNYELLKNSMVLNYELLDTKTNEVEKSKTINIKKIAYKNLKVKPKNIDFDALLNSGFIRSSSLKVSLKSNRGSDSLLFENGEDVELFIKLNKMGYVYIVGYTQTSNTTLSYLLELNEGHGDSKFKMFINADDANRWISLGRFTVEAPFGVESLQIIASNKEISSLPLASYDEDSGYYIISKNITKVLTTTRGLKKKKSKKVEISEDVMSFTTIR